MKINKVIFIVGFFLSNSIYGFSQCVSIELSVEWERGYEIFKENSEDYVPKLLITYRNNSDTNLYFLKISDSRGGNPLLSKGSLVQYPIEEYINPNYYERAKVHGSYKNKKYNVIIGGSQLFNKGWIVENDTLNSEVEHEIDPINDDLTDIYEYIFRKDMSKNIDSLAWLKTYFLVSDITVEQIINKYKDKFVFLKPGEKEIDSYNLSGFNLIKGCFSFNIEPNSLQQFVLTSVWDQNRLKFIEEKTALPEFAGDYKLYSGHFNSNKIIIDF